MVQNEQLVRSYELLDLPLGTGLEETHRIYLEQLDIWNPNAIDEDANPALYQQVKQRRQEIDQAHRSIVEYHEQSEGMESVAALDAAMEPAQASEEHPAAAPGHTPGPAGADVQPGPGQLRSTPTEISDTSTALQDGASSDAAALDSTGPTAAQPSSTFVQSEAQMQPGDDHPEIEESLPVNSRVVRSYGGALPDGNDGNETNQSSAVFQLLRWDKPAGRVILMIPALWAAFLASGSSTPSWKTLVIIVLGSIATSAAGCAVNDLWDQEFDSQVARTQNRPLAAGQMSRKSAITVLVICCLVSILLALQLNWISIQLCVAAGIVILLYPGAKRVFPVPQLVLAIAWGFAVLIGWAAVTGTLSFTTFLLWLATVLWTLGFDTVYAMADQEDDRRIGLNSSALFFADRTPDVVGLFFAGTALFMLFVGINQGLSWQFWLTLVLATVGWLQQHRRLSRSQARPTSRIYGDIFTQNVWLGVLLLAGMILGRPLL